MNNYEENNGDSGEFAEKYQAIRGDLKAVLIWNGSFIIVLIILFFINHQTDFLSKLERLF